jgi:hypothetical protein
MSFQKTVILFALDRRQFSLQHIAFLASPKRNLLFRVVSLRDDDDDDYDDDDTCSNSDRIKRIH